MKLTIERNELLNVLKHVTGVVEKRNTIPVLSNILINATKEAVSFVATDMEIEINECVSANVEIDGSITVPAQTLFDIARKLNSDDVTIQSEENGHVSVFSGRSRFKLSQLPVSDFPIMDGNKWDCHFKISASDFVSMIDRVRFAMSSDEVRYYLNGVYIHSTGDKIKCVATDSHRLAVSSTQKPEGFELEKGVIVPRKTVNEVQKILSETNTDITISINQNKIGFMIGDTFIQSKLIDGTYPDYDRIIPQTNDKVLTIDVSSFVGSVDRVSTVSNEKTRAIKLELMPHEISISSSSNGSTAKDTIDATFEGEPMDIGFNSKYLLELFQNIVDKKASVMIGSSNGPIVIEDESALFVLMPMRV